jgi:hypothetical protein
MMARGGRLAVDALQRFLCSERAAQVNIAT